MVTMNLPGRQKFLVMKAASILAHEQGDAVIIVFHAASPVPDGSGGGAEFPLIPLSVSRVRTVCLL